KAAADHPQKPAILFEGASLTYAELNVLANRMANMLAEAGVRCGDRVAIFLPNIPQFAPVYIGILKLGAIAVSIISRLKVNEVRFILEDCSASALVTSSELLENVPLSLDCPIFAFGAASNSRLHSLDDLLALASPERTTVDLVANAPAAILYTSGTTGTPKGA